MATVKGGNLAATDEELEEMTGAQEDADKTWNLEEVDENAPFELIPPGTYNAEVAECEDTYSKKGARMLKWKWAVFVPTGDEDDPGGYRERTLFMYSTLTEQGYPFLKRALRAVAPDMDLRQFSPRDAAFELVQKKARLKIVVQPDNQDRTQKRNNIKEVLPPASDESGFFND